MNLIHTVVLGVVEGLTEFLPVSSTAHLIITSKLLGLESSTFLQFFEIVIQSGAIFAVVLLFWRDVLRDTKLIMFGILAFIPTAIIGLLAGSFSDSIVSIQMSLVLVSLLFIGVEMLIKLGRLELVREIGDMRVFEAILIGTVQAAAIVPGVSRAGAVILIMMIMGYKRGEAARFSFILAIPTILAASAFYVVKTHAWNFSSQQLLMTGVGFLVAFISAWVVVKWFIKYLQTHTLMPFAIYRLLLAGGLFLVR